MPGKKDCAPKNGDSVLLGVYWSSMLLGVKTSSPEMTSAPKLCVFPSCCLIRIIRPKETYSFIVNNIHLGVTGRTDGLLLEWHTFNSVQVYRGAG